MKPKQQLTVMVTRPYPQGETLCALLSQAGYATVHLPAIAYDFSCDQQEQTAPLNLLSQQDVLIFISAQAAHGFARLLTKHQLAMPNKARWVAIGAATAEALGALTSKPIFYPQTWSSEGLLQDQQFSDVAQQKIMIIQGNQGRELLAQTLQARGAVLTTLQVYQRVLPDLAMQDYQNKLQNNEFNVMVCTSFASIKNLKTLFGVGHWQQLKQLPLIVASARIKQLAFELGFATIWLSENASNAAILATLDKKKECLWQTNN